MKMKIKYEDAAYIRRYKKNHLMERLVCTWYIQKINEVSGRMELYAKWWFYLLTFIPLHIFKLFACMWDGGLKEFEFESRKTTYSTIIGFTNDDSNTEFGRFKEIWEKYYEKN